MYGLFCFPRLMKKNHSKLFCPYPPSCTGDVFRVLRGKCALQWPSVYLSYSGIIFDDIKNASIKLSDWGKLQKKLEEPPDSQTQYTFCNSKHNFCYSWDYFHINSVHVPNGPVGTDKFLRLSLGRLW